MDFSEYLRFFAYVLECLGFLLMILKNFIFLATNYSYDCGMKLQKSDGFLAKKTGINELLTTEVCFANKESLSTDAAIGIIAIS